MIYAPTILVIGQDEVVKPYVEALSSAWPTQGRRSPVHPAKRGEEDVIVELRADGACIVRRDDDRLELGAWPLPHDLRAIVGAVVRAAELDRQLGALEEMEPLGVLACSVAHDANNLLSPLLIALRELALLVPEDGDGGHMVRLAEEAALRVAALMRRMLSFRKDGAAQVIDLNSVVLSNVPMLRSLVGSGVEIVTQLCSNLPALRCDAVAVERILVNLCTNARDALPLGGTIRIATRLAEGKPNDETRVVLSVADDGTGMLPETLSRAFEPLFTTKPPGRGTGLGLTSVRRMVARSRGEIRLESKAGNGTTVNISWPLT